MKLLLFLGLLAPVYASSRVIEIPVHEGEAKILYPCSVLEKLKLEDAERYLVTFYEKNERDLRDQGLILRKRDFQDKSDFTLKSGRREVSELMKSFI